MTDLQREFYNALFAPFHDDELSEVEGRGSKKLTYIDKRALENRLDTVCGPDGWRPEYRFENGVYICTLSILVPGPEARPGSSPYSPSGWIWVSMEVGGGNEGMIKKVIGEITEDTDNDAKSFFTNALRRAAQDAWGKGVSLWYDPDNRPLNASLPARAIEQEPEVAPTPEAVATPPDGPTSIPSSQARCSTTSSASSPPTETSASDLQQSSPIVQPIQLPRDCRTVRLWSIEDCMAMNQDIARTCKNPSGSLGEVSVSLVDTADVIPFERLIAWLDGQLAHAIEVPMPEPVPWPEPAIHADEPVDQSHEAKARMDLDRPARRITNGPVLGSTSDKGPGQDTEGFPPSIGASTRGDLADHDEEDSEAGIKTGGGLPTNEDNVFSRFGSAVEGDPNSPHVGPTKCGAFRIEGLREVADGMGEILPDGNITKFEIELVVRHWHEQYWKTQDTHARGYSGSFEWRMESYSLYRIKAMIPFCSQPFLEWLDKDCEARKIEADAIRKKLESAWNEDDSGRADCSTE
jgi:hypothetical protein